MHKRSFREPDILAGYERILSKHFPEDEKKPSIEELEAGATAMLSMGHPLLLTGLRPVPPNFVYIGKSASTPSMFYKGHLIRDIVQILIKIRDSR